MPLDVAQRLAPLDENEGAVLDYGNGARVLMLCRRTPALIDQPAPPYATLPGLPQPARRAAPGAPAGEGGTTPKAAEAPSAANAASDAAAAAGIASPDEPPLRDRDQVRSAIFNRKISAAADAYLAELRADAVIRKP